MPPRRRPRGDDDDVSSIISRGSAAVSSDLPPLASRIDTSYGSAPSTTLRNNRRGQVRNLQNIVQDVLNDEDSDDDPKPTPVRKPKPAKPPRSAPPDPQPDPEPSPEPQPIPESQPDPDPDFGPGPGSDSPPPMRDQDQSPSPSPAPPIQDSPPQPVPPRIPPKIESSSFQDNNLGLRVVRPRALPARAPPRGPDRAPSGPPIRRASSEGPANTPKSSASRPHLPGPSTTSVFYRAISEAPWGYNPGPLAQERPGLDRSGLNATPDSVRTFGQESSLFGDAIIRSTPSRSPSPLKDKPIPTIEEEDLPAEASPKSPVNRILRQPRQNPPAPPRSLNHADRPRNIVRSPIASVADQPAPDIRHVGNAFAPAQREPPSTPPRDRLHPQWQSPRRIVSPAAQAASSHQAAVDASAALLGARSQPASVTHAASSRSPGAGAGMDASHVIRNVEESRNTRHDQFQQSPPRTNHQIPPRRVNPSHARAMPAPQPASSSPQPFLNQANIRQTNFGATSRPANDVPQPQPQPQPLFTDSNRNTQRQDHTANRPDVGNGKGGLFASIARGVARERRLDEAQQQALQKERRARLEAWPRIYNTLYRWTGITPPDTPVAFDDSPEGRRQIPPRRRRQLPRNQFPLGAWIMFTIADTFADLVSFFFSPGMWLVRTIAGVAVVSFLAWVILKALRAAPALGLGGLQWYGFADMAHNLGQFVPLWMSQPSTMFSDEDTREYIRQQRNHGYELAKLTASIKLHEASLSRLDEIVPKVVHMKLDKDGRPVVSQEFYHALRDLMKGDSEVLTLDRGHGGYHFISDEHWRAVRDRLRKDPVYQSAASPPKPGTSATEVENIVQTTFSRSWEMWLKDNNKQVARILEPAFGTSIPDKIEKDLESKLEKYVKDLYKDKGSTQDVVVTREEFIRHLKGEFATHRNEVKAEAQELQKKLEQYVNQTVSAAMSKAKALPDSVSRAEISQVLDDMIRQAIANAGLEALAKGKIAANWNSELRRQVNFLNPLIGTIVDGVNMSPTYKPVIKGKVGSPAWLKSAKQVPGPYSLPADITMFRWEDEGECWCGQVTVSKEGRQQGTVIGYMIGHEVVPQHLVVEHILPGATLNPDARPRDIEVWAYITEVTTRGRAKDFSASHFPNPRGVPPQDGWVLVGAFAYESNDALDGAHVYQFSPELMNIGAATDHILLMATSNYGADHTCFYRVRLFGERRA